MGAFITFFKSRIAFANAFRNAFLELLRLSSLSQNHDYEYTVRPRKTDPWNKGMLWPSAGVYDFVPLSRKAGNLYNNRIQYGQGGD